VAALELHVDLGEGVLAGVTQGDEAVVDATPQIAAMTRAATMTRRKTSRTETKALILRLKLPDPPHPASRQGVARG